MYGDLLRRVRTSRGMTQAEVAEVSGISQPNISAYERGHRIPSAHTLNVLLVSCGYELVARAGDRAIACDLPKNGWFPDDDLPPAAPDDPVDERPTVTARSPRRLRQAAIDAAAAAADALVR
jgi:transcriptional regulator with XRE-family HTH domain